MLGHSPIASAPVASRPVFTTIFAFAIIGKAVLMVFSKRTMKHELRN